jgi:alkylation response protein AidB-like acyl-CoA dehydrogenase
MDLSLSDKHRALQQEVRAFIRQHGHGSPKLGGGRKRPDQKALDWQRLLVDHGYVARTIPREYGGFGAEPDVMEAAVIAAEFAAAGVYAGLTNQGISMLVPTLLEVGTDEQRQQWIGKTIRGDVIWCQGYSEPGAGSDLASVKTSAVRGVDAQGDHYIVNGQKTWTTLGQHANMIFCLVRTNRDAKKQEGISFLLIDMTSPGVEVRPIITLDGEHEVNEVFFSDVRVPAENLVGEEHKGWTCAKYLLTYERTNIAGVGFSVAAMEQLKAIAAKQTKNGRPLAEDPAFAARMASVEIDLENMKTTNLRVIAAVAGGGVPGAESSMLKIRGTEIRQEISSLTRRALGSYARPFVVEALEEGFDGQPIGPAYAAPAAARYFNNRKLSIFGGSNEIQKNIISKMILGL